MNRIVIVFIAAIAILALGLTSVILLDNGVLDDNDENVVLNVADFVEYNNTNYLSNNTSKVNWLYTELDRVIGVNDTDYSVNITIFPSQYPGWNYSLIDNWDKNWTFGNFFDLSDPENEYGFAWVGKSDVGTKWGPINCDLYTSSNSSVIVYAYVKNGILVKMVSLSHVTEGIESYGVKMLTDTNISVITD